MQSTLSEAEFFAAAGFDDILYAVPISPDKLPSAAALMRQIENFHVMIDNPAQFDAIESFVEPSADTTLKWSIYVMVDCGWVLLK